MKRYRILSTAAAGMLCAALMPALPVSAAPAMRDISTRELVRDMGLGINLGNTLEAAGDWIAQYGDGTPRSYETAWGSPVITREMIEGMAKEGFGLSASVAYPAGVAFALALFGGYVYAVKKTNKKI